MPWPARFFKRKSRAHKNDFGHLLVLAGSRRYAGAGSLAARAAMRSGAGLVTLGFPESLYPVYARTLTPEIMLLPLSETGAGSLSKKSWPQIRAFFQKADCCLIGPGLAQYPQTQDLIRRVIVDSPVSLVIDADGLNALAGHVGILSTIKAPAAVLTPHPKEMARLTGESVASVQGNRKEVAKDFAYGYNMTLVLKGFRTVVASPGKIYVNQTGNPGMATAGSGDVLSGIVAAFLGQGMGPFEAAWRAVYIHGLAGDLAAKDKTQPGMIASDIIEYLPKAFKQVISKSQEHTS